MDALCVLNHISQFCHIITAEESLEYIQSHYQTRPSMRENVLSYSWFCKLSSHVTKTVIN